MPAGARVQRAEPEVRWMKAARKLEVAVALAAEPHSQPEELEAQPVLAE